MHTRTRGELISSLSQSKRQRRKSAKHSQWKVLSVPCTSYYKNLSIDESNCTVKKEGQPIHLTAMEYQLFVTLLDHSGRVCSRNLLLSSAWHITTPIQTRTVDVHIAKLRKKLDLGQNDLKTVTRQGYALSG